MVTRRAVPSLLVAALATIALGSVVTTLVGLHRDAAPEVVRVPDRSRPPAEPRPETEAAAVLAGWDAERFAAWAAGDVHRLRALYTPGSVAGQRDAAMLRRWLDRDLTVEGLRTQVLSLHELRRSRDRWVLAVTDRVVGGRADDVLLPTDTATAREVVLRRVAGQWLVASVRLSPRR